MDSQKVKPCPYCGKLFGAKTLQYHMRTCTKKGNSHSPFENIDAEKRYMASGA